MIGIVTTAYGSGRTILIISTPYQREQVAGVAGIFDNQYLLLQSLSGTIQEMIPGRLDCNELKAKFDLFLALRTSAPPREEV